MWLRSPKKTVMPTLAEALPGRAQRMSAARVHQQRPPAVWHSVTIQLRTLGGDKLGGEAAVAPFGCAVQ